MSGMRRIWRLGYWRSPLLLGVGWRHLVWRFYWYSPSVERRHLETYARTLGLEPIAEETTVALRARIAAYWESKP